MAKSKGNVGSKSQLESHEPAVTVADDDHPDYIGGTITENADQRTASDQEGNEDALTHVHGGPFPQPFPFPNFCWAVSGRYRYSTPFISPAPAPGPVVPSPVPGPIPRPLPGPIIPINLMSIKVRVDVDRFFPQQRISIEVSRLFPSTRAHAIAEVTSDVCSGFNRRTITANIVYRDGNNSLIPGTTITFYARRTTGFNYRRYKLQLSGSGITPRSYNLQFESRNFDPVEFEVDRVSNAGSIVTTYNTATHPNKPANLPDESLSLATVYQRAGFDVTMSPNTTIIPTSGAGANGTWSDSEMHNAMVTYWSRFTNRPKWALWVLYAARHDQGRGLGGIMFDDIGPNHRQGTAIFTDSFIQDVPAGDPNPAAWRNRMQFWTVVHEMGHAFNLAHAWQKALGTPQAPGDPWIPLANEPEARSYMNYPFRVSGGESAFFSNFRFRFSDDELVFMRHAPRRFVQMGNSNWFNNHGFEAPDELRQTGRWALEIRPNREANLYRFLEPVNMELKLTNMSDEAVKVEESMLSDGRHISVFIQREGGETKQWRSLSTRCHKDQPNELKPGESIYGAHLISASTEGWVIDEPGFYKVQAATDVGDEIIVSNVLRLYVAPPSSREEAIMGGDYFTEDIGRAIVFTGAPSLEGVHDVLEKVVATCADNPASRHAVVALSSPKLRDFKVLDVNGGREGLVIKTIGSKVPAAAKAQHDALLSKPNEAADTLGHIHYFGQLRTLAEAMEEDGDEKGAVNVMSKLIDVMKARTILPSVIDNAERRLKRRT